MSEASHEKVARLLSLLPGVRFYRHYAGGSFRLQIDANDSLGRIAIFAKFANAKAITVNQAGLPAKAGEVAEVYFELELSDARDDDPPNQLEIFGIFLVRYLKAAGLIEVSEADELQRGWNAVAK